MAEDPFALQPRVGHYDDQTQVAVDRLKSASKKRVGVVVLGTGKRVRLRHARVVVG